MRPLFCTMILLSFITISWQHNTNVKALIPTKFYIMEKQTPQKKLTLYITEHYAIKKGGIQKFWYINNDNKIDI